jgi:nucleoside-diphosphate-sugar epimerase
MAMIARAFARQDPFVVWGTGEQIRNWTYVDDIVQGFILAAERIEDGAAVNLGSSERIRVLDCAEEVIRLAGYQAKIQKLLDMPSGVLNRAADTSFAQRLLGRVPQIAFQDGLRTTWEWYIATKDLEDVKQLVSDEQALLTHRMGRSSATSAESR